MDRKRVALVRAAIDDHARADGTAPSLAHVCQACARLVGAGAVWVSLTGGGNLYEPLYATGPAGEALAELQVTVGEGPGVEAVTFDRPVLVTDLDTADAQRRWPLFAPAAVRVGAGAVFAFPLLVGAIAVGVLEISGGHRQPSADVITDGLLFADAALLLVVAGRLPEAGGPRDTSGEGFVERWPEVHQATGMVAVQLDVGLGEAFARLRAYAYGSDLGLRDVAHEVVGQRLRFEPDEGPQ